MTTRFPSARQDLVTQSDIVSEAGAAQSHTFFVRPGYPNKDFRRYANGRGGLVHPHGNLDFVCQTTTTAATNAIDLYGGGRFNAHPTDSTEPDAFVSPLYLFTDYANPWVHKQPADQQVPYTEAGIWGKFWYSNLKVSEQSQILYASMLTGTHIMQTGPSDNYYGGSISSGQLISWGSSDYYNRDFYMNNAFTDVQLWGVVNWNDYNSYGYMYAPPQQSIVMGGCKYIYNASTARILLEGYWYPGLPRSDYLWGCQVYNASGERLIATLEGGERSAGGLGTNGGLVMAVQSQSAYGDLDTGFMYISRIGHTDPTAFTQEYKDNLYCPPGTVIDNFLTNRTGTLDGRHVEWITPEGRQYSSGQWELKGGVTPTYVVDATFGNNMIQFNSDPAVDFIWLDYDTDIHVAVSFDLGTSGTGEITFIFRYTDNQNYEYYYVTAGSWSYGEYVAGVGSTITAGGSRTNRYQNTINFNIQKTYGSPAVPNPLCSSVFFNGDRTNLDSGGTPPVGITNGIGFSANKGARVSCVKITPMAEVPGGVPNKWDRGYCRGKSEYCYVGDGSPLYSPRVAKQCRTGAAGVADWNDLIGLEHIHGSMIYWASNNGSSGMPLSQYKASYNTNGYIQLEGRHHTGTGGGGTPTGPFGMVAAITSTEWWDDTPKGHVLAMDTSGIAWRGAWGLELYRRPGYSGNWNLFGYGMHYFSVNIDALGTPHTGGHPDLDDGYGTVILNNQGGQYPLDTVTIDQTVALHPNIPNSRFMYRIMTTRHMNEQITDENAVKFITGLDGTWDLGGSQYFYGPTLRFIGADTTFTRYTSSNYANIDSMSNGILGLYIGNGEPDETTNGDNNWATKIYAGGASGAFSSRYYDEARWFENFSSGTGSVAGTLSDSAENSFGGGGDQLTWQVSGALGSNPSTLQTNGVWSFGGGTRRTLAYLNGGVDVNLFLWSQSWPGAEVQLAFRIVDGSNFWVAGFWTDETAVELVRIVADTPTVMATHTRAKFYDPSFSNTPFVNIAVRVRTEDILLQNRFYTDVGAMTADTTHNTATNHGIYNSKSGNPNSTTTERFAMYDLDDPKYLRMWTYCTGQDE